MKWIWIDNSYLFQLGKKKYIDARPHQNGGSLGHSQFWFDIVSDRRIGESLSQHFLNTSNSSRSSHQHYLVDEVLRRRYLFYFLDTSFFFGSGWRTPLLFPLHCQTETFTSPHVHQRQCLLLLLLTSSMDASTSTFSVRVSVCSKRSSHNSTNVE